MLNSNGIIVILSYPDTVVRPAYWELSSKIWPLIGIGGKHAIQAGHAALLLIHKNKKEINYFDFGRYITTYGNGRVRSKETDAELHIPINAEFDNGKLINLNEILIWLDKHPEKTHGEGRLVASINTEINFDNAQSYIKKLINKKEIKYGAFIKNGSNCARFVTDTIIASSTNKRITSLLTKSNLFTPSPIGNVIKGTSTNEIYNVENKKISSYKNRSIVKEYKASFFKKFDIEPNLKGTENPNTEVFILNDATWLGGIGSGCWFKIEEKIDSKTYKIARYTSEGKKDFEDFFTLNTSSFEYNSSYTFIHPTNCKEVYIEQNSSICILKKN